MACLNICYVHIERYSNKLFVILKTACSNISYLLYEHNKCLDKSKIHYSALKCPIPLDKALQIPGNLIYKLHDSLKKNWQLQSSNYKRCKIIPKIFIANNVCRTYYVVFDAWFYTSENTTCILYNAYTCVQNILYSFLTLDFTPAQILHTMHIHRIQPINRNLQSVSDKIFM